MQYLDESLLQMPEYGLAPIPERPSMQWHVCRLEAICDSIEEQTVMSRPATIRAFCTRGMAFLLADRLVPGAVVSVRLTTATDRVAFAKLAHVVHDQRENLGDWLLGVVFLQPLSPEEVTWLLSPEAQANSPLFFEI